MAFLKHSFQFGALCSGCALASTQCYGNGMVLKSKRNYKCVSLYTMTVNMHYLRILFYFLIYFIFWTASLPLKSLLENGNTLPSVSTQNSSEIFPCLLLYNASLSRFFYRVEILRNFIYFYNFVV